MKHLIKVIFIAAAIFSLSACTTTGTGDVAEKPRPEKRVHKSAEPTNYDLSRAGVGAIADIF